MAFLKKPLLGPIVGHTTEDSCKLWIAAYGIHDMNDIDASKRTIGIIGLVDKNGNVPPENIWYFRMKRCYHRTGYFDLGKQKGLWKDSVMRDALNVVQLQADTIYQVRMAYIELDTANESPNDENSDRISSKIPLPSSWVAELNLKKNVNYVSASFKTQPKNDKLSFLLGSCRYTAYKNLDGGTDRIFHSMYNKNSDVNMVLMVGDQIYADYAWKLPVAKANTYKEFEERYHTNFGSSNFRELVSHIPTYMILDDHEIENNWTADRFFKSDEMKALATNAIVAYRSFQWIHGPDFSSSLFSNPKYRGDKKIFDKDTSEPLYYDFSCCDYPFFVLDTRTSRYKNAENSFEDDDDINNNHIIGRPALHEAEPGQLERLCEWLKHSQIIFGNRPKFIVSSTVFVPNPVTTAGTSNYAKRNKNQSDSWAAFPVTRELILRTIGENNIKNVIFLSGDIHCGVVAKMEIRHENGTKVDAWSIVSSPLYWPINFMDGIPSHFVHDSSNSGTPDTFSLNNSPVSMDYLAWGFVQTNNFARIDILPETFELRVQYFDTDGNSCTRLDFNGNKSNKSQKLKLENW